MIVSLSEQGADCVIRKTVGSLELREMVLCRVGGTLGINYVFPDRTQSSKTQMFYNKTKCLLSSPRI